MTRRRPRDTDPLTRLRNMAEAEGLPALAGLSRYGAGRGAVSGLGLPKSVTSDGSADDTGALGQLFVLSTTGDSIASGSDYLTFDTSVFRRGFDDGTDGTSITWPENAVGYVTVEFSWATYEGGGTIEVEVNGSVPDWGGIAAGSVGADGAGTRTIYAGVGDQVKIKVTQSSGSAQTCDAVVEFSIPGSTSPPLASEGFPLLLAAAIPTETGTGTTFYDETFSLEYWNGTGSIVLANDSAGTIGINIDDRIVLDVTDAFGNLRTFAQTGSWPAVVDVTDKFVAGSASIRIRLIDTIGVTQGASNVYLVNLP